MLEYHVICIYGSDDSPFGAVRRFNVKKGDNGQLSLVAARTDTQRKTSWLYKRKIHQWLQQHV